jgi:hypothetical protein
MFFMGIYRLNVAHGMLYGVTSRHWRKIKMRTIVFLTFLAFALLSLTVANY